MANGPFANTIEAGFSTREAALQRQQELGIADTTLVGERDDGTHAIIKPISEQEGISQQIAAGTQSFANVLAAPEINFDEFVEAASEIADRNLQRLGPITEAATETALTSASQIDQYLSERFYQNIENILPTFREDIIGTSREALQRVTDVARDLISGEVPEDVADYISRTRAELGLQQGLFGEIQRSATARDLGMTSLDLTMQGVEAFTGAVSPLTQNLLSQTLQLTPPTTDVAGLFTQAQQIAAGATTISPTSTLQAAAQTGISSAQASFDAQLSQVNAAMDIFSTQALTDIQQQQIDTAQQNAIIQGLFSLGGSALGTFAV